MELTEETQYPKLEMDQGTYDWFLNVLSTHIVQVMFKKQDGTERVMNCTLRPDLVVPYEKKSDKVKKPNLDIVPVWDLDKSEWRSFKISSLVYINLNVMDYKNAKT